ncbi:MAG: hypothetical protein ACI9XO_003206 [Paraglaciecola sp.]|jgi:hypothetical protein
MNKFYPFKGIQNIWFGMKREQVKKVLNEEPRIFLRNKYAENTTDYYQKLSYFVMYDKNDVVEAIEFINKRNLLIDGEDLFNKSYSKLRDIYDDLSRKKEEEGIGITYYDLGFGASHLVDSNRIETIIIFSKTYW